MKNKALQDIAKAEAEIRSASDFIHSNPELGFEERKAVKRLTALLEGWGFKLETPVAGLDTAFKATWGSGKPSFCFMAEYDALPGIGHACGHNLIAAASLAAAAATKAEMERKGIPGSLVVFGTPGEEGKGGKVTMVEKGLFNGIGAGVMSHPYNETITDHGCLSVSRYIVAYKGSPSHAAVAPEHGINALDAVINLFNSVNAWRQQLPEPSRIHGIITNGGEAPNIIPEFAEAFFYVRAADSKTQLMMEERFMQIAKAAGDAAGAETSIEMTSAYKSALYNAPINDEFATLAPDFGMTVRKAAIGAGRGSTDFGDVSQAIPCAHLHYDITSGMDAPLHTAAFREASASDFAFSQTMKVGAVMSLIALRYFTDSTFRDEVANDFNARKAQ